MEEITLLLRRWREGSVEAEQELWPLVYRELRRVARNALRARPGHGRLSHGTTSLVHEAYLRLLGATNIDYQDRGHFFAVAARAMRFVLVDEARRRLARKREGEVAGVELPEVMAQPGDRRPEDILAVHDALEKLAQINPRYEKLVEMRYFAGLSVDETAVALAVSRPTVVRDWQTVRTWLYGELGSSA